MPKNVQKKTTLTFFTEIVRSPLCIFDHRNAIFERAQFERLSVGYISINPEPDDEETNRDDELQTVKVALHCDILAQVSKRTLLDIGLFDLSKQQ